MRNTDKLAEFTVRACETPPVPNKKDGRETIIRRLYDNLRRSGHNHDMAIMETAKRTYRGTLPTEFVEQLGGHAKGDRPHQTCRTMTSRDGQSQDVCLSDRVHLAWQMWIKCVSDIVG